MAEDFVNNELDRIKGTYKSSRVEAEKLVTCVRSLVRIELKKTDYKHMIIHFQFPPDYPHSIILIELKSKVIPISLLKKLTIVAETEARKFIGEAQILHVIKKLKSLLFDNLLVTCYDEIKEFKNSKNLSPVKLFKTNEKTGLIYLKLKSDDHFMKITLKISDEYPLIPPKILITKTNFSDSLRLMFIAQSEDLGRKLTQGEKIYIKGESGSKNHRVLKKNTDEIGPGFKYPKPSLKRLVLFLINDCFVRLPTELCCGCQKNVLKSSSSYGGLERLYCSHFFHSACLHTYMINPPFKDKACPACKKLIYHPKYNNQKLLEDKWAHKQAKLREIGEVNEFLNI